MMDIILLAVGISIVSFYAGWKTREWVAQQIINRMLGALASEAQADIPEPIKVEIEKEGDKYFVYNKENHTFLAQGESHEEIKDILVKKYPNQSFITDRAQAREIGYIDESI